MHFFPNPYYMIEPTADMVKIYEMCNALFPVYDPNNVSNFLFIPFEWANNFWQSWTTNVTASASTSRLSVPSKTTSGRKKVLVMLVNKPDWFEPGEMTYLGFDNDYSVVPLSESDKIDFSINYSDTSKKFLDGTAYDGTPRGPKKIIRYAAQSGTIARNSTTGAFECTGSGTGRLYIPRKAMVRLTVSSTGGTIKFTNIGDTTTYTIRDEKTFTIPASSVTSTSGSEYYIEFNISNLKLIFAEVTNLSYTYVQPINTSYSEVEMIGPGGVSQNLKWGTRVEVEQRTGIRRVSKTCPRHVEQTCTRTVPKTCSRTVSKTCTRTVSKTCSRTVTTYGPGTVDLTDLGGGMKASDTFSLGSSSGWRWYYFPQALNKSGNSVTDWYCGIAYGSSKFVLMSQSGYTAYSTDYGVTWTRSSTVEPPTSYWRSIVWDGSYFVILTGSGGYSTYSSNGTSWNSPTCPLDSVYTGYLDDDLSWNGSRLFAMGDDQCIYSTTTKTGASGWTQYTCDNTTRLGDGEHWKYGNGYYAKEPVPL